MTRKRLPYLTPKQIADLGAHPLPSDSRPRQRLRDRLAREGQWSDQQRAGRDFAIGCVSLEITQRCNLDCTLCYLSELSQAIRDVPIEELFRRIDLIHAHYGPGTNVQVSGGDPTLRRREELVEIVRYIHAKGMRSALFTNGIRATRDLLIELRAAGLTEVAFHVDITQQRKGYKTEAELNAVRTEYIERARGTGLGVFFNTTICAENFAQIPAIVDCFLAHADVINMASFQLQAETGRGVLGERDDLISQHSVRRQIEAATHCSLNFDAIALGHSKCNKYAVALVAGSQVSDALGDERWVHALATELERLQRPFDRAGGWRAIVSTVAQLMMRPRFVLASLPVGFRHLRRLGAGLRASRGRVHAIAFFLHNFMDAERLECDRIGSCTFMAATPDGPMSMCLFNAKRDQYLLRPLQLAGKRKWYPLGDEAASSASEPQALSLSRKTARGSARVRLGGAEQVRPKLRLGDPS